MLVIRGDKTIDQQKTLDHQTLGGWNAIIQFQNLPHKTININNLTYRSSPHFLIGNYLKKRSKPEDLVLLSEAGIIPYYSKLTTRDYLGLVSSYKIIYSGNHHLNVDHLLAEKPRYIILSFGKIMKVQSTAELILNQQF